MDICIQTQEGYWFFYLKDNDVGYNEIKTLLQDKSFISQDDKHRIEQILQITSIIHIQICDYSLDRTYLVD